jgi:L-arabinose isomerase
MLQTELVMIDAQSSPAAFADRLRWNQAYHLLARGFQGGR